MIFLSVDPSINNVGLASFNTKTAKWASAFVKLQGVNRQTKMIDLKDEILTFLNGKAPHHLVTEYPAFYSSEKGQIAAHSNWTIDLAFICGFLFGRLVNTHREYSPITAIEWKGNVRKEITARKFMRKFGDPHRLAHMSEHEVDATMMLYYFLYEKPYGATAAELLGEVLPEFHL